MAEYTRVILRQGPNEDCEDVVLRSGEPAYITDYKRIVVGDGNTLGGVSLGSKFLGFVEFDEFSSRVNNVTPGLPGDFIFETTTNLLYILSGTEAFLGRKPYEIKTNYVEINKTPNPDNINIYNNGGFLSIVPNSLDGRYLAGYSIGRGLTRNINNPAILQMAEPGAGLAFENNILVVPERGIVDNMLSPMPANTIKGRLYSSGAPENYNLDEIASVLKTILAQGEDGLVLGVPIGTIIDYAGERPPANYLPCDGSEYTREDFLELFSAIGTTWGAPTTATFLVPNLNKRTTVGSGSASNVVSDDVTTDLGSYGGKSSFRIDTRQLPPHTHGISFTIPAHSHSLTLSVPEFPTAYETGNIIVNSYNSYINVIQSGPQFAPVTTPNGSIDSMTIYRNTASNEILKHKRHLQQRVVEYVKSTFPLALSGASINDSLALSAKCFRDTGYIVDSIAADISNNANHRSVETGTLYFSGFITAVRSAYNSSVPSLPEDQVYPTIAAISAIGGFITGISVPQENNGTINPILSSNIYYNLPQQFINNGFNIYTQVISNSANIPKTIPNGGTFTNYVTAASGIGLSRSNLQLSVVQYAKTNYFYALSAPTLTEELALSAKCFRDTGYVIDSLIADLVNNANHRSVETGTFYFSGAVLARPSNQGSPVPTLPTEQITATVMSISSLNLFINNLGLPLDQNTKNKINELINTVIFPIQNNGVNKPYDPSPVLQPLELRQAADLLLSYKSQIQNTVSNYVVSRGYLPNFSVELAKCKRDIGFMVDSVAHYLNTGTNAKVVQYALAYWDGSSSRIPDNSSEFFIANQKINTLDTIRYLNSVALNLFTDNNSPSIANEVLSLIKTMMYPLQNNGTSLNYNPPGIPLTPDRQLAANILKANRENIRNRMRLYVDSLGILNNLPNSLLLKDKCSRDVGYMIDSVISDLLNGTNAKSVQFALAYWDGSVNRIGGLNGNPNQIIDTVKTVQRLKDESLKLVLNETRVQGLSTIATNTYLTSLSGDYRVNELTGDGSINQLFNDPVFVVQPTAVVNKCIKAK